MTGIVDNVAQIVAAVGGVAGVSSLFRLGIDRRKGRADAQVVEGAAARAVTDSAVVLVKPLHDQIDYLSARLLTVQTEASAEARTLRSEVRWLRSRVAQLIDSLRAAKAPIPDPDTPDPSEVSATPTPPPSTRRQRKEHP